MNAPTNEAPRNATTEKRVIRPATVFDAPAIARLCLDSRQSAGKSFPESVHEDEEFLPHLLRDVFPHSEVWLMESRDAVLGVVVLKDDLVTDLYVAPGAQKTGVGTSLLDHAKSRRPDGIKLWVFASNTPAQQFYQKHGFVSIGGTDGDNEEKAPDVLFRWTSPR